MCGVTLIRDTSSLENARVEERAKRSTSIDKEKYFPDLKNTIVTSSELLNDILVYFIHPTGEAKRWHEPAGSAASIADEMPTDFSVLLAPR